jgi:hypothetical protein
VVEPEPEAPLVVEPPALPGIPATKKK